MESIIRDIGLRRDLLHGITLCILIFGRLVFAVFFTPFFGGGRLIPARVKMGASMALVALLYPALSKSLPGPLPTETIAIAGLFIKECFIGLNIALMISMVFYGIQAAGQFIDNQRGLSSAAIFNPALGAQASLTAQLLFQLSVVLFFLLGGHRIYISAIFHSFEVLPVIVYPDVRPEFADYSLQLLAKVTGGVLAVAIQLSAPVAISMFLAEVVLGVANRVAPQMDVLFISYTLKAMIGLLVIFFSIHLMFWQVNRLFEQHLFWVKQLIDKLPGV